MPDSSSLDKRFSDIVGDLNYKNNNLELSYNYALDQNFKEMNYNVIETKYSLHCSMVSSGSQLLNLLNAFSPA